VHIHIYAQIHQMDEIYVIFSQRNPNWTSDYVYHYSYTHDRWFRMEIEGNSCDLFKVLSNIFLQ